MAKGFILKLTGGLVLVIGLMSLFMTISIIFDLFDMRSREGNYVPLVVYANFICSVLYLLSAYYLFRKNEKATIILFVATIILVLSYLALIFHIREGLPYEIRTVVAMTVRTCLTAIFMAISWYHLSTTRGQKILKQTGATSFEKDLPA